MIPEIKAQLGGIVPDAIVCSVGGGGLINGIILGLQEAGWSNGMYLIPSSVSCNFHNRILIFSFNFTISSCPGSGDQRSQLFPTVFCRRKACYSSQDHLYCHHSWCKDRLGQDV